MPRKSYVEKKSEQMRSITFIKKLCNNRKSCTGGHKRGTTECPYLMEGVCIFQHVNGVPAAWNLTKIKGMRPTAKMAKKTARKGA